MKKALLTLFFAIASRSYAVEFGDIPAEYTLYSAGDPFAIALATNNAAVKMNINNGTSTNQTLRLPLVADHLSFSLGTAPALGAGKIAWDPDWLTFKAGLSNGVEGQFFQEHHVVAKNAWTNTIPNGWVVMHSGVVGNSGKYEVVPAISTPPLDPTRVIGMTTEDIPVGALGRITARGNVNQIGSDGSLYGASGWQNNTPVYLCTTHVGWVTTNIIQAPYPRVYIGNIVRAHTSGAIYIRVQPGLRLSELDDVDGTPLAATGQIPVWDNGRQVFDFNRNVNEFLLASAFGTWTSTNEVTMLSDMAQPTRYFTALENGTGTVYEIAGPFTNLAVTLSSDFLELDTNTRPAWTNNVFPFTDGAWQGFETGGSLYITHSGGAVWDQPGTAIPATLSAVNLASGYASVSVLNTFYTTNAVRHFATETELDAAKAQCGTAMTNLVIAATNSLMPYAQTVYGDFTTTNETGYAAFVAVNPSTASAITLVPASTPATNTALALWPIVGDRVSTARLTGYSRTLTGTTLAKSMLSYHDASGKMILSNEVDMVNGGLGPHFTNALNLAGINANVGSLRATFVIGGTSGVAKVVYSGTAQPMTLSVTRAPTPYVTVGELTAYPTFAQTTNIAQSVGGGITNGQAGVTLDGPRIINSLILSNGTARAELYHNGSQTVIDSKNGNIYFSLLGGLIAFVDSAGLNVNDNKVIGFGGNVDASIGKVGDKLVIQTKSLYGSGTLDLLIPSGNLCVSNDVCTAGKVKFGPTIDGKQAHLFSNGTNLFFVNVNYVTNSITTN